MKALNAMLVFAGGLVAGAALGVLFAPEKGESTRNKIADSLRKRGIKLKKDELEEFVDELTDQIKL